MSGVQLRLLCDRNIFMVLMKRGVSKRRLELQVGFCGHRELELLLT